MKKNLLVTVLALVSITVVNAQDISIGARGGINFANISESVSGGGASSYKMRTSVLLGGYAKIMFNDKMGIQPELFFSSVGAKESPPSGGDITYKLNYLSLPIFFRYNFNEQWHLLAGPQLGVLMSAKAAQGGNTVDIKSNLNSSDFGLTIGVGADFDKINVGARYCAGLANFNKTSGVTDKNNVIQIVAGYKLFGKK